MIKTLRITSLAAAILAGVLIKYFVFPMISDVGGDQGVEKALNSPGVIERFKETKGAHAKPVGNQTAPLVQQATAYALYLNPPPKVKPRVTGGNPRPPIGPVIGPTSPKFLVYATTYFEANPELSQALIDEPGKGRHWVRQSSMVGHLLIEQIKDGVVVVKSSKETFELEIVKTAKAGLPKGKSPLSTGTTGRSGYQRTLPSPHRTANSSTRTPSSRTLATKTLSRVSRPSSDPKSSERTAALLATLRDKQRNAMSGGKTVAGLSGEESAARIGELLSLFASKDSSAEDAKDQAASGQKLKDNGQEPNRTSPTSKTSKIVTGPAKPDAPKSK